MEGGERALGEESGKEGVTHQQFLRLWCSYEDVLKIIRSQILARVLCLKHTRLIK